LTPVDEQLLKTKQRITDKRRLVILVLILKIQNQILMLKVLLLEIFQLIAAIGDLKRILING